MLDDEDFLLEFSNMANNSSGLVTTAAMTYAMCNLSSKLFTSFETLRRKCHIYV